jgi:Phosphotransferase enzyme family
MSVSCSSTRIAHSSSPNRTAASFVELSVRPPVPNCLHGWLAAVLPVDARRFRVSDRELAATLEDAGAEVDGSGADVEIVGPGDEPTGASGHVIANLSTGQPEGGRLLARAPTRLWESARVRLDASRWRAKLRRLGYDAPSIVLWDCEAPIFLPGIRGRRRHMRPAHLLPRSALVVGGRTRGGTVLEKVADQVAKAVGAPVRYGWPLSSEGLTVAVGEACVLRIAIGPGRMRIDDQRDALEALTATGPPEVVRDRVPWLVGSGKLGLADWSAERRLHGRPPPRLSRRVLADCIDFLVALYHATDDRAPRTSPAADADVVAAFCGNAEAAESVRALGPELTAALVDVPRGFGHGDFWWHNLLVTGDTLTGVIEWDAAGPGRLPLLDILHLQLSMRRRRTRQYLGIAVVEDLLPWARAGGDELLGTFCRRIGLRVDHHLLEAMALAYWLDRVASELRTFADRRHRPTWLRQNVDFTANWLSRQRYAGANTAR